MKHGTYATTPLAGDPNTLAVSFLIIARVVCYVLYSTMRGTGRLFQQFSQLHILEVGNMFSLL